MSHFECRLNRRFWHSKKMGHVFQIYHFVCHRQSGHRPLYDHFENGGFWVRTGTISWNLVIWKPFYAFILTIIHFVFQPTIHELRWLPKVGVLSVVINEIQILVKGTSPIFLGTSSTQPFSMALGFRTQKFSSGIG